LNHGKLNSRSEIPDWIFLFGCSEFTDRDASAPFLTFKDHFIEFADPPVMLGAEGGDSMVCLNFFDIESRPLDADRLEKVIDLLGMAKGLASDDCNDVEGNMVVLQQSQTPHRHGVRSLAATAFAVQIVKGSGTVDAQPNADVMPLEEVAPRLIQQGAIGLDGMDDPCLGWSRPDDDAEGFFIPRNRDGQWFAGMPDDRQLVPDKVRGIRFFDGVFENTHAHASG
jgi:hypothetical protein